MQYNWYTDPKIQIFLGASDTISFFIICEKNANLNDFFLLETKLMICVLIYSNYIFCYLYVVDLFKII